MTKQQEKFVPVYLFTGFLESGKTTFIQETLEDPRFNSGEPTLLLLCEEGEVELHPEAFASDKVSCRIIEEEDELSPESLERMLRETKSVRVVVEYNGMWMLDSFYSAMPEDWAVYQEFCFLDARTILQYNANMRQLTFDKLQSCEMAVFNRCDDSTDQMAFHQLVRTASRRADIIYEYADGKIEYDNIPDPLPFDLDADIVEIQNEDYATWYRDLSEGMEKYEGKTLQITGRVLTKKMSAGSFIIGRHVMTCCADDIQFAALVAQWEKAAVKKMDHNEWYTVTATLHKKFHPNYGGEGPVLQVIEVAPAQEPDPEVATFF